jgi:cysteine desulfurase/selenocysteine lyase
MGVGVLFGKKELLESMPPFQTGGGMIRDVSKDGFICADLPEKFEAGTPPVAEAVGLKIAIDWLNQFDWKDIEEHEDKLIQLAVNELGKIKELTLLGSKNSSGSLSFTIKGIHPHDLTDILGEKGICLRAGHHCAIPLHERLKVEASTRLSIGIYNTEEEILRVRPSIEDAARVFS